MRVSQSIFTWILDAACINGNALRTKLGVQEIALPEFKRRVALDLVSAYIAKTGGNTWNKRERTNELTLMICREASLANTVAPVTQKNNVLQLDQQRSGATMSWLKINQTRDRCFMVVACCAVY